MEYPMTSAQIQKLNTLPPQERVALLKKINEENDKVSKVEFTTTERATAVIMARWAFVNTKRNERKKQSSMAEHSSSVGVSALGAEQLGRSQKSKRAI